MTPGQIRLLVTVVMAVSLLVGAGWKGYRWGAASVQAKWDKKKAEVQEEHDKEVARLQAVNRDVEVRYLPKVEYIRGNTIRITKEVPVYVTAEDDAACPIPDGFVRLHDAAAEGGLPADQSARDTDDARTPVELSQVASTIIENYGACLENAEKLTALQEWARKIER